MLGALQRAFREPAFLRQGGDALNLTENAVRLKKEEVILAFLKFSLSTKIITCIEHKGSFRGFQLVACHEDVFITSVPEFKLRWL